MNIKQIFIMSLGLVSWLHAMERPEGYPYKDEQTLQDLRRIAILAYGSLVNDARDLKIINPFIKTDIQLPVSLSRLSSAGQPNRRITAVIDNQSDSKKNVWFAESSYKFLPNARNNLAQREGSPYDASPANKHLNNIFYLKKLFPGRRPDSKEIAIEDSAWVVRDLVTANDIRQKLSINLLKQIANWADSKGFNAVIWASFPPNKTKAELIQALENDSTLLNNTRQYVRILPDGAQTTFEKAILTGNFRS